MGHESLALAGASSVWKKPPASRLSSRRSGEWERLQIASVRPPRIFGFPLGGCKPENQQLGGSIIWAHQHLCVSQGPATEARTRESCCAQLASGNFEGNHLQRGCFPNIFVLTCRHPFWLYKEAIPAWPAYLLVHGRPLTYEALCAEPLESGESCGTAPGLLQWPVWA